jgi:hypothetical protein
VTDTAYDVFLSYSRNDLQAAAVLRAQLAQSGLSVFKDDDSIRAGDRWLDRLQAAIDGCASFVVLVGRDGVGRWIGAETQAALNRYFGPHEDAQRLPIFPILLGEARRETLPAFLRLFQTTPWNGSDPLPLHLLEQVRERTIDAADGRAAGFQCCELTRDAIRGVPVVVVPVDDDNTAREFAQAVALRAKRRALKGAPVGGRHNDGDGWSHRRVIQRVAAGSSG